MDGFFDHVFIVRWRTRLHTLIGSRTRRASTLRRRPTAWRRTSTSVASHPSQTTAATSGALKRMSVDDSDITIDVPNVVGSAGVERKRLEGVTWQFVLTVVRHRSIIPATTALRRKHNPVLSSDRCATNSARASNMGLQPFGHRPSQQHRPRLLLCIIPTSATIACPGLDTPLILAISRKLRPLIAAVDACLLLR